MTSQLSTKLTVGTATAQTKTSKPGFEPENTESGEVLWSYTGSTKRSDLEAFAFFCRQCITGDTADGIPGAPGKGEAAADMAFKNCLTKQDYWDAVCHVFDLKAVRNKLTVPLLTQAQVLRMKRSFAEQLWTPEFEGLTGEAPKLPGVPNAAACSGRGALDKLFGTK
jgi:hypothetical protein